MKRFLLILNFAWDRFVNFVEHLVIWLAVAIGFLAVLVLMGYLQEENLKYKARIYKQVLNDPNQ